MAQEHVGKDVIERKEYKKDGDASREHIETLV